MARFGYGGPVRGVWALLALAACSFELPALSPRPDAQTGPDAEPPDTQYFLPDGGAVVVEHPDAAPLDVGAPDTGVVAGPPTVENLSFLAWANEPRRFRLSAQDPGDLPVTISFDRGRLSGQINPLGDGEFEYISPPNWTEVDHFEYWANNAALQSTRATVTIDVVDHRDCERIQATRAVTATSSYQRLDPDGVGGLPAYWAYCAQNVMGGGWTLVARSAPGGQSDSFGWGSATGQVDNDMIPYSLGALGKIDFTEVLVLNGDGRSFTRGYQVRLPNDFGAQCGDRACRNANLSVVLSECEDWWVNMLDYFGYTRQTDYFFMRDDPRQERFGLGPGGFSLFHNDCRAGRLNNQQGVLFVRCRTDNCPRTRW